MIKKILSGYAVLLLCLFSLTGKGFAGTEITLELKKTIDKVITIVSDPEMKKNPSLRREKLRETIGVRFNYRQMVMRSLAKNYKERSDEERKEFTALFKKLLENSYASKIENYQDETIKYVKEQVKGKYALVNTEIIRKDGTINVDYKLINEDGKWTVYDFVIEEVSLIRNYRSQFSKIIKTESYDALVSKLSKKIKDLESNQNKDSKNL
ncbi:MAG: ABC transporter substrate-binding protein [Nitrospinota bacterium]|nr:ABC transporter substrate-binding protein [Nitrospinota bacterium]